MPNSYPNEPVAKFVIVTDSICTFHIFSPHIDLMIIGTKYVIFLIRVDFFFQMGRCFFSGLPISIRCHEMSEETTNSSIKDRTN